MRKILILPAILFQVVVLAFMAGEREHIVRNGKIIHLRTAPIDPRDMFRGDYIRLNYEISRIPVSKLIDTTDVEKLNKGDNLYAVLKEGPNGLYELVNASVKKPGDGVYIRGRIPHKYQTLRSGSPIWVNYGIEAYFVQQGKGRKMERRRGWRNEIQIPLEMEIAISHGGEAVIKGFRWSPLGIGLKILRSPPRNPQAEDDLRSATVRLTLANASNAPLSIVDLPNYCSFSLEAVPWAKKNWIPVYSSCKSLIPGAPSNCFFNSSTSSAQSRPSTQNRARCCIQRSVSRKPFRREPAVVFSKDDYAARNNRTNKIMI